jgi:hypothetical protein
MQQPPHSKNIGCSVTRTHGIRTTTAHARKLAAAAFAKLRTAKYLKAVASPDSPVSI